MAGSWTKGWAGWWLRRWPQLPPPPHVWVWAEEPPKALLLLWLLKRNRGFNQTAAAMSRERGRASRTARPPVRLVPALPLAFQDPLQNILSGICGAAGQL